MSAAFFWGLLAASSLILGGVIALRFRIPQRLLGLIMAFGAGVLISAVSYELVGEAFDTSAGSGGVALGLFAGAGVFFVGDFLIDRLGGDGRKSSGGEQAAGSALAIVLGIVLDGIPESIVIGLGLLDGGGVSVAVITAVFLSNLPEAVAATTGLAQRGLDARTDPRPLDGRDDRVRVRVAARLRGLRHGFAADGGVRPRLRRRRDPDDAGRHDDAGGVHARRQARRPRDDGRLRPRVRPHDARVTAGVPFTRVIAVAVR